MQLAPLPQALVTDFTLSALRGQASEASDLVRRRVVPPGRLLRTGGPKQATTSSSHFTFATAACVGLALVLGMRFFLNSMDTFVDFEPPAHNYVASPEATRKAVLARTNQARRRELLQQVGYIEQVVRDNSRRSGVDARKLAETIVYEAARANYDPFFVAAVIKSESTFRPSAISDKGAKGLMQLLPSTGHYISQRRKLSWAGEGRLHDPSYNIQLGIAYLQYLERYFKNNKEHILIAYNWGPGNLLRVLKQGGHVPASTKQYARGILANQQQWAQKYRAQSLLAMRDGAASASIS
jgi:soluble lytic murein transglycosylase-like protein